jgi:hypothetical protein
VDAALGDAGARRDVRDARRGSATGAAGTAAAACVSSAGVVNGDVLSVATLVNAAGSLVAGAPASTTGAVVWVLPTSDAAADDEDDVFVLLFDW